MKALNDYAAEPNDANRQWWFDPVTGVRLRRNQGMLVVSECMEGVRKDLMDDKIPHRRFEKFELVGALIRILGHAYRRCVSRDGSLRSGSH